MLLVLEYFRPGSWCKDVNVVVLVVVQLDAVSAKDDGVSCSGHVLDVGEHLKF